MERAGILANPAGKSVLDLGCGSGFLCHKLSVAGAKVAGIDLAAGSKAAEDTTWQFLCADLNSVGWPAEVRRILGVNRVDAILGFDIIEHVRSPLAFLELCTSLLAPSGRLLLTTPNVNSWERLIRPRTWSGARDPQHNLLFTRYSLAFLCGRVGLKISQLSAPMRSIERLPFGIGKLPIGAQLFAVAELDSWRQLNPPIDRA